MEPALDLQGAINTRLRAYAPLVDIIGSCVYDRIPSGTAPPYVVLDSATNNADKAEGISGSEILFTVEAFSRAVGKPEVMTIAGVVIEALDEQEDLLTLTGNVCKYIEYLTAVPSTDPDGLTHRVRMLFRALTEPL